jgi:hypothetical protein
MKKIRDIIQRLGGEVIESRNLEDGVTHFVTPQIQRSEKTLGLIAKGSWILHLSYVYDCEKHGRFLPVKAIDYGYGRFFLCVRELRDNFNTLICFLAVKEAIILELEAQKRTLI